MTSPPESFSVRRSSNGVPPSRPSCSRNRSVVSGCFSAAPAAWRIQRGPRCRIRRAQSGERFAGRAVDFHVERPLKFRRVAAKLWRKRRSSSGSLVFHILSPTWTREKSMSPWPKPSHVIRAALFRPNRPVRLPPFPPAGRRQTPRRRRALSGPCKASRTQPAFDGGNLAEKDAAFFAEARDGRVAGCSCRQTSRCTGRAKRPSPFRTEITRTWIEPAQDSGLNGSPSPRIRSPSPRPSPPGEGEAAGRWP